MIKIPVEATPVTFKSGYKYQLQADCQYKTEIKLGRSVKSEYIDLMDDGTLIIREGYAWDGASGPTIDTPNSQRGALAHDALYQLMRRKLISRTYRKYADRYLYSMCVADGMWSVRAFIWYRAVRRLGDLAAINPKKAITIPETRK